jgi:hypothetical protein
MMDRSIRSDYSHLDSPDILMGLFHPRPDYGSIERVTSTIDMMIPVENNIMVAGRFHMTNRRRIFFSFMGMVKSPVIMMILVPFTIACT